MARDKTGDQGCNGKHDRVSAPVSLGGIGDAAGGHGHHLAALHDSVGNKRDQGRNEQNNADGGAHAEILLADDLLVDIHGQDVVVAAHDLGRPEIGKAEGKTDKNGAHQTEFDPGKGHGQKRSAVCWPPG